MVLLMNFTKYFRKEWCQFYSRHSKKLRGWEYIILCGQICPNNKTWKTHNRKRQLQINIPHDYIEYRNPRGMLACWIQEDTKKIMHYDLAGFILDMQDYFNIWISVHVCYHINNNNKNYMIQKKEQLSHLNCRTNNLSSNKPERCQQNDKESTL